MMDANEKKEEEADADKPLSRAERRMKGKAGAPSGKAGTPSAGTEPRQTQDKRDLKRGVGKWLRWQRKR